MKVRVIKSFRDKVTKEAIRVGREIEISQERFSELTTGPRGVFVEEIADISLENPPKDAGGNNNVAPPAESPKEEEPPADVHGVNFTKMTKAELVELAKSIQVELSMDMTKDKMIEILLQK